MRNRKAVDWSKPKKTPEKIVKAMKAEPIDVNDMVVEIGKSRVKGRKATKQGKKEVWVIKDD